MEDKGSADKCPYCGFIESRYQPHSYHLPLRTVLQNRYILGKVLGYGGFGITYIAWDTKLNVPMAIKEYLPLNLAGRSGNSMGVNAHSVEKEVTFKRYLESFFQEAKTLARFSNEPGIASVQDFFEENATVYIVMFYVTGETLETYMLKLRERFSFDETLHIMLPVMEVLSKVHSAGVIHRDISPDNIYITSNNQVKLLDFGAARYSAMEEEKSVSVILKRGYAPFEQYSGTKKSGPWTDVYAIAATMYRMLTGETPPEATDRIIGGVMLPPSAYGIELPGHAEWALMKALAVESEERFQSMDEFVEALQAQKPVSSSSNGAVADGAGRETVRLSERMKPEHPETASKKAFKGRFLMKKGHRIASIILILLLLIIMAVKEAGTLLMPAAKIMTPVQKLTLTTCITKAEEQSLINCTKLDTGIELVIQNYGRDGYNPYDYENYLEVKLASGSDMDLLVLPVSGYKTGSINAEGTLLDLTGVDFMKNVSELYIKFAAVNGKIYSVPNGPVYLHTWLYNRRIYEELGLQPPQTWNELLSNCEKIKTSGRIPIVAPFKDVWTSYIYYINAFYYISTENPNFEADFNNGSIKLRNTPGFIKALSNLQQLSDKGYFNKDLNETDYSKGIDDFAAGRAVHFPMGAWVLRNLNTYYSGSIKDISMFEMPSDNPGALGTSASMPLGLCILKTTGHTENAKKFLKYYLSKDTINKLKAKQEGSGEETYAFAGIPLIKGFEFSGDTIPAIKEEVLFINAGNINASISDNVPAINAANGISQIIVDTANRKITPETAAAEIDSELEKAAKDKAVVVR